MYEKLYEFDSMWEYGINFPFTLGDIKMYIYKLKVPFDIQIFDTKPHIWKSLNTPKNHHFPIAYRNIPEIHSFGNANKYV